MPPATSASSDWGGGGGAKGDGDELTALLDRLNDRKMFLLFYYGR